VRRLVASVLFVLAALALAGPADAATVATDQSSLTIVDSSGQPDDLRLGVLGDGTTFTVTGTTAQAGAGCSQHPGLVVCPSEFATSLDLDLGAGDDRLVVDVSGLREEIPETRVAGGEGDDTLVAHGLLLGGPGDDMLRINQPSDQGDELDGDAGNDELFAGSKAATLVGGPGTDVLHGGPGNDSLIDTTDRGSRDTIGCGGGRNQVERDAGDKLVGCSRHRVTVLALVKYFWTVWPGGFTQPVTLMLTPLPGEAKLDEATQDVGSWTASCRGKACHRARFSEKRVAGGRPKIRFRLRGGVRVPGKRARAVLPGSKIRITYRSEVASYIFVKQLEFLTRERKLPRKTRRCFASRITYPQLGSGTEGVVETGETKRRRVPCK
jgi:hypothetical protein